MVWVGTKVGLHGSSNHIDAMQERIGSGYMYITGMINRNSTEYEYIGTGTGTGTAVAIQLYSGI
jgi:hypothetical protein